MSQFITSLREGGRLLTKKGSRLKMIVASTLAVFFLMFPMLMGIYTSMAIFGENGSVAGTYAVAYGIIAFLGIFVTLPAMAMLLTYAKQTYSEAKYGYAQIKKRGAYNYFRNLFSSWRMFFWSVVALLCLQAGFVAAMLAKDFVIKSLGISPPFMWVFIPVSLTGLIAVGFIMWLRNSRFLTFYYFSDGSSVRRAVMQSKKGTARHPFYSDLYALTFIILFVLSLLTFGVLFILWVLPLMMFTYFEIAERMDGETDGGNKK